MSGIDEQIQTSKVKQIVGLTWDRIIEERDKWSIGYLECSSCGIKLYQLVPWSWRVRFKGRRREMDHLKREYLKRFVV